MGTKQDEAMEQMQKKMKKTGVKDDQMMVMPESEDEE